MIHRRRRVVADIQFDPANVPAILEAVARNVQRQRGGLRRRGPEIGRAAGLERGFEILGQVVLLKIHTPTARTWPDIEADKAMLRLALLDRATGIVDRARFEPAVELAQPDRIIRQSFGREVALRTRSAERLSVRVPA